MKQDQTLILLTSRFPYSPGEEFIYNELLILSQKFQNIILVPTNQECWNRVKAHNRELPDNVKVHTIKSKEKNPKLRKIKSILSGVTNPTVKSWYKRDVHNAKKFGLKGKFKLYKWLVDAYQIRKKVEGIEGSEREKVVYYSYWLTPAAAALAMLKEDKPIKAVSRVHGGDLYWERHPMPYLPVQYQVIQSLDKIHSISENGKQYLLNNFPGLDEKIEVSRLGTKGIELSYREPDIPSKDPLKIVSVSYMKNVKRVHLIAEAIKKAQVPVHWIHIGDGPEREKVQNIINQFPETSKGELLGSLDNEEVIETLRSQRFDLFINVSESEGIPVTIMEAFSARIPVVATDVGGTSELVNGSNGWLLDKDFEPGEISNILNETFAEPELISQKRDQAYRTWREQYSCEKNYSEFAEKLLSLGDLKHHGN
ncbi:glycosyltransferase [Rossellomorea sp. NRS-1567]|uniref:glycosyltransferase n=1 Tax=Rossellomorea sp. NRS-1567 TaxID=3233901 RepID=UPI003D272845